MDPMTSNLRRTQPAVRQPKPRAYDKNDHDSIRESRLSSEAFEVDPIWGGVSRTLWGTEEAKGPTPDPFEGRRA